MPSVADIEHLLRRTEFVARPHRVTELAGRSLEAAVDDIMTFFGDPGTVSFTSSDDFQRGVELTYFWLDRMALDSPRPLQERMALFWHGHFCSGIMKVEKAVPMRDQLDLFRRDGLTDLGNLTLQMAMQPAMLRYLDNNQNKQSSPNQNFGRELMELFTMGVGNYTEADVEACAAAWTGHSEQWETATYEWHPDWHDNSTKQFLGTSINQGGDAKQHGPQTVGVILGNGTVPPGAPIATNRGRPTRDVVSEFLTRKLWKSFAGTPTPNAVLNDLASVFRANNFQIRPWVRALLLRPEFYSTEVRQGLVAPPMHTMVKMLAATGLRASGNAPIWWMDGMGQRPLMPPDVSGWGHNVDFVNASAMARRSEAARFLSWKATAGYWAGDGLIRLAGGTIHQSEIDYTYTGPADQLVDRFLSAMRVSLSHESRSALVNFAATAPWHLRHELVLLILLTPELHTA